MDHRRYLYFMYCQSPEQKASLDVTERIADNQCEHIQNSESQLLESTEIQSRYSVVLKLNEIILYKITTAIIQSAKKNVNFFLYFAISICRTNNCDKTYPEVKYNTLPSEHSMCFTQVKDLLYSM